LETSRSKFYAGGDVITGASNVSNAMGTGKKAARNIDLRLMAVQRWDKLFRTFEYSQEVPAVSDASRHEAAEVPAAERVLGFDEATMGLTAAEAMDESGRCLRCDIRESHHQG
jgi:NADPH-dependent glutamate synthase beta subunit-like oxidoreductase